MRPRIWTALAGASFALLPAGAAGQGWSVSGSAGQTVHHAIPGGHETLNATVGLRYEGPRWLYSFGGYPLDGRGTAWLAGGVGGRFASRGAVRLGLDAAADAYTYRHAGVDSRGVGRTLTAMPLLLVTPGRTTVELRSGLMSHSGSYAGQSWSRSVHQSDARVSVPAAPVRLFAEARHLRAEEGAYAFAGGGVEVAVGQARLWSSAGRWLDERIDGPSWALGGAVGVARRTQLIASYRRDADDPLYWTGARTSWSFAVGQRLGPSPRSAAAVPLAPPPDVRGQHVSFRIPLTETDLAPSLAGDFTGWEPVPMVPQGRFWVVALPVPPGLHRYAFRRPDGEWFVPDSLPGRVDDGFGGASAVVFVPASPASR
jgi:hypothetical protein